MKPETPNLGVPRRPPRKWLCWLTLLLVVITAGLSFHVHACTATETQLSWQDADSGSDDCALCQAMAGANFSGIQSLGVSLAAAPAPSLFPTPLALSQVTRHAPSRAPPSLPVA